MGSIWEGIIHLTALSREYMNDIAAIAIFVGVVAFLLHCPLLKPWFGFRKPKGHRGHWFE